MINNKRVLALIPARGGSKGIKDKNIINLGGKPLIAYTIEAAIRSEYIDAVVVSTDSKTIADIAKQYGADIPFIRPDRLARDESKTIEAVLHAIEELKKLKREYDILILLQPTQPLRNSHDIDKAIIKFFEHKEESLVSISPVNDNPVLIRVINDMDRISPLLPVESTIRRQDMPKYYKVNGCIYINKISELDEDTSFNDNKNYYLMEQSHSVDIDEESDIAVAKYYLEHLRLY